MATLTAPTNRALAHQSAALPPLGPFAGDNASQSLASSHAFPVGTAGTSFVAVANGEFHLLCGTAGVIATTSSPGPFPAGSYQLTLPDGCTHVAMVQGSAGAASGCAYPG